MIVLYLGLFGFLAFISGVGVLGLRLRKNQSKENAEKLSRIMHFLFFAGLVSPGFIGIFYPGLTHFDKLVGLSQLPLRPLFVVVGVVLAVPGLYFLTVSNKSLRALGSGANAFILTQKVVGQNIYRYTRNPMSLGYYLVVVSMGFISSSTLITACGLLGVIPAHIFFLKYFEELELEIRFGQSYKEYKQKTPFLFPKFSER